MNSGLRALIQLVILLIVIAVLIIAFPAAQEFVELAARELRVFWWMILLVALAVWLIWGVSRKPKK
ncbi:MAG: hypothetical protein JWO95_1497 [Verrucomicrobiales bacterium]|nr:hypothetical protein [Verrucomicrobiales bacterium]